jgi:y4mF family transcriptional regulator
MTILSQLIQSHRKAAGLTQARLATLAGVGKTVVWDLEHGKESVQWDTLQKILQVLNITVEWHSPFLKRAASESSALQKSTSPPAAMPSSPSSSKQARTS